VAHTLAHTERTSSSFLYKKDVPACHFPEAKRDKERERDGKMEIIMLLLSPEHKKSWAQGMGTRQKETKCVLSKR
jgi:hypothetical protein